MESTDWIYLFPFVYSTPGLLTRADKPEELRGKMVRLCGIFRFFKLWQF